MEKYCFNVCLNDNNVVQIVPNSFVGMVAELSDYDKYVNENGGFLPLCSSLAQERGINPSLIKSIKILQTRTGLEFSLIVSNPYLNPVLNFVSKKVINGYGEHPYNGMAVDNNCPQFIEMKNYLFNQLVENRDTFFGSIYTYKNEFSSLLSQYATLCKSIDGEDESRGLQELRSRILKGLSMYKNYRGLCKSRYEYENSYRFTTTRRPSDNWKVGTNIQPKSPEFDPFDFPQKPLYEVNQFVNDLGEEKEEFLEEEELWSEDCYGKRR